MAKAGQGTSRLRGLFDRVSFGWWRSPVHIEGAFRGEPDWEKLGASTEGRNLLACARDWPRLTPGIPSFPEWEQQGGVFVVDLTPEQQRAGDDSKQPPPVSYEAFREVPLARPPLYQQFASLPLHLDNHLCAFASAWGFPEPWGYDGKRSYYPVLALQYQSRVLRLTLQVLAELRRNAEGIFRDTGPYVKLLSTWLLRGVSDRIGDSFVLPPEGRDWSLDWGSVARAERIDRLSGVRLAVALVQNIFSVQLGTVLHILEPFATDLGEVAHQFRGCRPLLWLDFAPDGQVDLGPGWTCDSLLQRIWLQAFGDVDKAAALTQCSCGCNALLWLKGKQLRDYCEGKRTWASGHRASAVGRERRERLKAERSEQYLPGERKRVRAYRAGLKKRRQQT